MKTQKFLNLLQQHSNKALLFSYAPGQLVGTNYHITEVKHVKIESVDCGAGTDNWNETIIQLWESPSEIGKPMHMSCYKALGILKKVGSLKPYDLTSEVKIEYSNALFHTAQLFVNDYEIRESQLFLTLGVAQTDCKAKEACGLPISEVIEVESASCAPGSGCC